MKKFRFEIPAEMRRLAVVGIIASLLTTAMIYSRNGNLATEVATQDLKQKFQQPKDREQAEGWFIPTPKVAEVFEQKGREIASALLLPRPRPHTSGFYYELVRAQGDGEEGEYVLIERKCVPQFDMPEPCYLPERERRNFPLRRDTSGIRGGSPFLKTIGTVAPAALPRPGRLWAAHAGDDGHTAGNPSSPAMPF